MHIVGHRAETEGSTRAVVTSCDGGLSVEGWRSGESVTEALVWIPGFNASIDVISKAFAQLLALGSFPAFIKPFVFAWPNGRELTYFHALRMAASAKLQHHFTAFLRSIIEAGVRDIHFLCHSMGARIMFSALPEFAPFLASVNIKLVSCTFLNADYSLSSFIERDFEELRTCCEHVTLYADAADNALFFAEHGNREQALGRHPYALISTGSDASSTEYLSLDVIDTTALDTNVHGMRHAYFNLNRFIIDDLTEVVTTRRRAHMRRQLTHRGGNVWSFLAAPSFIRAV